MPRATATRALLLAASLALLFVVAPASAGALGAQTAPAATPTTAAGPPLPKAWILVDADTGAVLGGTQASVPQPPASTIKLLTALMAAERLPADDQVPISALAESMPARKINVKAGQTWDREDLLYSLLLVSANDAAVALAERIGEGSLDRWVKLAQATGARLGMADGPVINDPSGLDDEFSHNGGSLISAHDLAIVARAVLARQDLMAIANSKDYHFHGGDGLDHELNNHDTFLGLYDGATGLKTGLTDKAGRCLVATATRDGRTMLAVEFDAVDIYASARQLLDEGFATPVAAEASFAHLPDVVPNASVPQLAVEPSPGAGADEAANARGGASPASGDALAVARAGGAGGELWNSPRVALPLFAVGMAPALVVLRRRVVRRGAAMALSER